MVTCMTGDGPCMPWMLYSVHWYLPSCLLVTFGMKMNFLVIRKPSFLAFNGLPSFIQMTKSTLGKPYESQWMYPKSPSFRTLFISSVSVSWDTRFCRWSRGRWLPRRRIDWLPRSVPEWPYVWVDRVVVSYLVDTWWRRRCPVDQQMTWVAVPCLRK